MTAYFSADDPAGVGALAICRLLDATPDEDVAAVRRALEGHGSHLAKVLIPRPSGHPRSEMQALVLSKDLVLLAFATNVDQVLDELDAAAGDDLWPLVASTLRAISGHDGPCLPGWRVDPREAA